MVDEIDGEEKKMWDNGWGPCLIGCNSIELVDVDEKKAADIQQT